MIFSPINWPENQLEFRNTSKGDVYSLIGLLTLAMEMPYYLKTITLKRIYLMSQTPHPLLKLFKILHYTGLAMVILGIAILVATDLGQAVSGMVAISSLLGLGGVMMSPFPVALFIQWASKSESQKECDK